MIVARLEDAHRYAHLHAGLTAGFDFLRRSDLAALEEGRHEIQGDQLFAIIARGFGRGQENSPLEFHRRYLDIQYVVSGIDAIGWLATQQCRRLQTEYDSASDLGFFRDRPRTWCHLSAGDFAIFFPEDAHAPLGASGPFHKVVVKVAC